MSEPFLPPHALESELLHALEAALPGPLFERLHGSLHRDGQRLRLAECKVRLLEERLRLLRITKYGPASERLSDAQLELLEAEPGVSAAEVAAEGNASLRNKHPNQGDSGGQQGEPSAAIATFSVQVARSFKKARLFSPGS